MTVWLIVALCAWVAFNLAAPWLVIRQAQPMSMGRVPHHIAEIAQEIGVHLYTAPLAKPGGYSVLAWPRKAVVFDRDSLARTPPWALRFLIAHELGHCALGHIYARWVLTVTGLILLPFAERRWLRPMEREADAYAEQLTGLKAGSFHRPYDHPA